jgi:hypothetical protein
MPSALATLPPTLLSGHVLYVSNSGDSRRVRDRLPTLTTMSGVVTSIERELDAWKRMANIYSEDNLDKRRKREPQRLGDMVSSLDREPLMKKQRSTRIDAQKDSLLSSEPEVAPDFLKGIEFILLQELEEG